MMTKPLFSKCRRFFPDLPEHVFRNLLLVCSAIVLARSTNLNVLKDYLPQLLNNDHTKADSHYKRLIRFFRLTTPNRLVICILQFVFRLFHSRFTHLILDATTWRVGQKPVHLLTLCMLYRDTAIPIYWLQLNKKGHSSEVERQELMTAALRYYRLQGKILLADREYIGENRTAEAVAALSLPTRGRFCRPAKRGLLPVANQRSTRPGLFKVGPTSPSPQAGRY